MQFGRPEDISNLHLCLPEDNVNTLRMLKSSKNSGQVKIYIGAPVWANKSWAGKIYPLKAKASDVLNFRQKFCRISAMRRI